MAIASSMIVAVPCAAGRIARPFGFSAWSRRNTMATLAQMIVRKVRLATGIVRLCDVRAEGRVTLLSTTSGVKKTTNHNLCE